MPVTVGFPRGISQASWASRISEGRVRGLWQVDISVGVGLEALVPPLRRVLGVQRAGRKGLSQEVRPARVEPGQLLLELVSGELAATAGADRGPQVAVQLEGGYLRMSFGVEGIDILCNNSANQPQFPQVSDGVVARVGRCLVKTGPAEEAPGPVPLARLMAAEELVVVDGSVSLVDPVRAVGAPVVCEPRGDGEPCAGEDDSRGREVVGRRRGEEVLERGEGAGEGAGRGRGDGGWRKDVRVGDAHERFPHWSGHGAWGSSVHRVSEKTDGGRSER
ncbi:hypothetical protein TOPH_03189 [Tolypocladium ophioglossoides CBS 100239]|uniref:Uncharacterized protein n=1 Tax=Tolypocladium ophioglossoides (strain CBS 100239) TaxID=1163406 RepID=A0A0L0NDP2_TOLOC|nr:hypothetical protein TOPH_03189 [Tolypocladium ophioglossoides CBS 100239]